MIAETINVFRFAWRNLWRNRSRTGVVLAAVTINILIMIVTYALMQGMLDQAVGHATNISVGEAQAHHPDYRAERSFYDVVDEPDALLESARTMGVPGTKRSYGFGLAAMGTKSAGAQFWGIDPGAESGVFDIDDRVQDGAFLKSDTRGGVVLGRKLAFSLSAEVGDELVVLVQCADGSMGNELYTVTGVLGMVNDDIDRTAALMHADDFEELFVSGGRVHEVAFNSRGAVDAEEFTAALSAQFPGAEIKTWRGLLPALSDMLHLFDGMIMVFGSIFCLAAGLGVMNALLMATFERIREFGAMKALGATPLRIVRDVAAEALVLAALAGVIGVLLSLPACRYLAVHGIDTSSLSTGITYTGIAFDPVWRAVLTPQIVLRSVGYMVFFCIAASLYPAVLAARLRPVDAMRKQ
ncbi:MAG TPA: ABC transporter permease [bacterium]|nr:ABC transporter permease [bacterium]